MEALVWYCRKCKAAFRTEPRAAMAMLGRDTGELRLPMTSLNDDEMVSLKRTLTNYGLL